MSAPLNQLVAYLDDYLRLAEVPDYDGAFNGLQVEGRRDVRKVALAVDACLYTIQQAEAYDADLLLVHHGLFWGQKAPILGNYYRRLEPLIRAGIAVYSCHLPLDAHPEVGNNHCLLRSLDMAPQRLWAKFQGVDIAVAGRTDVSREEFVAKVRCVVGTEPFVMPFGPERVQNVGVLTGAGGKLIAEAAENGLDTLVTGEGSHESFFEAEEHGINVLYAGHYATETFGVKALGQHLERQFGLETVYIAHPSGL